MRKEKLLKRFVLLLAIMLLISAVSVITASAILEQHEGFPVTMNTGLYSPLIVQDLDLDGKLEIVAETWNARTKVFDYMGVLKWENGSEVSLDGNWRYPIVKNLIGDDTKLEVLSAGLINKPSHFGYYWVLDIWDASGIKLNEIFIGDYRPSSPGVTKDGTILIATAWRTNELQAFDLQGNKLWSIGLDKNPNIMGPQIPVGDVDGDGIDEAVILGHNLGSAYPNDGKIWVIKVEKDKGTFLWSKDIGGATLGAAIDDLNGDGLSEVVAVSTAGVYILDRNGNTLSNFNIQATSLPSIGDLDGDGIKEVVIASWKDGKIYIISNESLKEFPAESTTTKSPALGDLDGDGKLEIVTGSLYYSTLSIWNYTGSLIERTSVGKKYDYFTSAVIADLEGDGNKEIILGNRNGNIYVFTYRKDITPPITTATLTGIMGQNSWYTSEVMVTLEATDDSSGVAKTEVSTDGTTWLPYSTPFFITNEGITTINYKSTDYAGNVELIKNQTIKIDQTPPTISGAPTTLPNANGWYNTDVVVNFTASDGISGIDTVTPDITISTDGVNQSVVGTATDVAGNSNSTTVSGINIDKTPPLVTINTPVNGGMYILNQTLIANWSAEEPLSGVALATGTVPNGAAIDTSTVGTRTFSVTASSNSGNTVVKTLSYTIAYNFLGIIQPIRADGSSIFKPGRTVPVKFRIADANGNYMSTAIANLTYQKITDEILGTVEEAVSTSSANEGNTFRYDNTDNLYIFNLGTEGMNTGTYQLNINLDDGTTHTVRISLR